MYFSSNGKFTICTEKSLCYWTHLSSLWLCIKRHTNEQQEFRIRWIYITLSFSTENEHLWKGNLLPFSLNRSKKFMTSENLPLPMISDIFLCPSSEKVTCTLILGWPWLLLLNNLKLKKQWILSHKLVSCGMQCSCLQQEFREE